MDMKILHFLEFSPKLSSFGFLDVILCQKMYPLLGKIIITNETSIVDFNEMRTRQYNGYLG